MNDVTGGGSCSTNPDSGWQEPRCPTKDATSSFTKKVGSSVRQQGDTYPVQAARSNMGGGFGAGGASWHGKRGRSALSLTHRPLVSACTSTAESARPYILASVNDPTMFALSHRKKSTASKAPPVTSRISTGGAAAPSRKQRATRQEMVTATCAHTPSGTCRETGVRDNIFPATVINSRVLLASPFTRRESRRLSPLSVTNSAPPTACVSRAQKTTEKTLPSVGGLTIDILLAVVEVHTP
eukprot:1358503-Rhodomonas_salina.1